MERSTNTLSKPAAKAATPSTLLIGQITSRKTPGYSHPDRISSGTITVHKLSIRFQLFRRALTSLYQTSPTLVSGRLTDLKRHLCCYDGSVLSHGEDASARY